MTLQRIFFVVSLVLFGVIGAVAFAKKQKNTAQKANSTVAQKSLPRAFEEQPIEIDLQKLQNSANSQKLNQSTQLVDTRSSTKEERSSSMQASSPSQPLATATSNDLLPDVDNINVLFQKNSPLSIVETIRYKSRAPWKSGKAAWLVDYASHYNTPIDFIARSLNGRADYTVGTISDGREFNILRTDRDFSFHLVIDLSRCKLWLYCLNPQEQESYLLKTYRVGLGRLDHEHSSGSLTPIGTYKLGSRIAVFKPKMMGMHKGKRVELVRIFGSRWIPFESEVDGCTEPAKGFGIHGTPWQYDEQTNTLADSSSGIGKYESDGCIRLKTDDIQELYAVISTRPATVELVRDFHQSKLPFKERTP